MEKTKKEVILKVKEALRRDAERGIARIDRETMQKLGVKTGDVIEIIGRRRTAALVVPLYPEESGQGVIRIDGTTRRNAGVGIDDEVRVRKLIAKPAEKIVLAPTVPIRIYSGRSYFTHYLSQLLNGRPLMRGDTIKISGVGIGGTLEFVVTNIQPYADAVIVNPGTEIVVSEKVASDRERKNIPAVTYEDIGGLEDAIQKIREMVELPLKHPEIFRKLGIDPPKGVLLHGPPGTGKTLLAKAVANETNASFYHISGPEIMSKFYGQSEENLRNIFAEAWLLQPSIIYFDEIDSIAQVRSGDENLRLDARLVNQLLTLMDGMDDYGNVCVIGSTNRVELIDRALLRPGRFDYSIEVQKPTIEGCKQIFLIHTQGMPIDRDFDREKFSKKLLGLSGAEIAFVTREAAYNCIRRNVDLGKAIRKGELETIDYHSFVVCEADFVSALNTIMNKAS